MLNLLPALILLMLQGALGVEMGVEQRSVSSQGSLHSADLDLRQSDAASIRAAIRQLCLASTPGRSPSRESCLILRLALQSMVAQPEPNALPAVDEVQVEGKLLRPPSPDPESPHPGFGEGARTRDGPISA